MINKKIRSIDTQFTLAKMWHVRGKFERAIAGYQQIIKMRPDYIAAHLELGELLTKQGRIEEAISIYKNASSLNPNEIIFNKLIQQLQNKQKGNSITEIPISLQNSDEVGHKRILLYSDCTDTNGVAQCNHLLLCELKSIGYRVIYALPKASNSFIDEQNKSGISHLWIENCDIYNKNGNAGAFINYSEVENLFASINPDLIIFSNGSPLSNMAARQTAAKSNIPFIDIIHCVTIDWAKQFASHMDKLSDIFEKASNIISVSEENLNSLRQHFGLSKEKGQVIYNGRPSEFFKSPDPEVRQKIRQGLNIPTEAVVAFTSGRMEIVKGYQYQVESIKVLQQSEVWQNLYFVWAGTGTIENNLRATVERLEATSHVRFLGQQDDIPALLDAADIFILPSHFEGMPLSVMEAMAKGLPVIATSVSGTPEELGDTGKLLPNPEIDRQTTITQLANTIETWTKDKNLRQKTGTACKRRAEKMFRVKSMLGKYMGVIETTVLTASPGKVTNV